MNESVKDINVWSDDRDIAKAFRKEEEYKATQQLIKSIAHYVPTVMGESDAMVYDILTRVFELSDEKIATAVPDFWNDYQNLLAEE